MNNIEHEKSIEKELKDKTYLGRRRHKQKSDLEIYET